MCARMTLVGDSLCLLRLSLEKRWGVFLMMAGVVVSRQIVDVQGMTVDSRRNVNARWMRGMMDKWRTICRSEIERE